MDLPALRRSVRVQRVGVCLVWLLITVKLCATLWLELSLSLCCPWNMFKALFVLKHWAYTLGLFALSAPVALLLSLALHANEPAPVSIPRDIAELSSSTKILAVKWLPISWLQALFWSRAEEVKFELPPIVLQVWQTRPSLNVYFLLSILSSWQHVLTHSLLAAVTILTGTHFVPYFDWISSNGKGRQNDLIFGFLLALAFLYLLYARKQTVLQYRSSKENYPLQLAATLPVVGCDAAWVVAMAITAKLVAYTALSAFIGLPPKMSYTAGCVNQLLGGSLCAICWCVGVRLVNIVYTHRVKQFQEQSEGAPSALLIPALQNKQDQFLQQAAFQDLCYLAEAQGPNAWRSRMVFEKDNGETWHQIGTICVDQVNSLIGTAAAVLPQNRGQGQLQEPQANPQATTSTARWNAPVLTKKALIAAAAQPSELRAWHLHSHRQQLEWSMRTLAAFAAAAASQDKKGIIHDPPQADCPDVTTIFATLLSAQLVLKEFREQVIMSPLNMQQTSGQNTESGFQVPSEDNSVGHSAYLLEQAAKRAVQTAVKPYGNVAVSVLNPQRVVYQPAYGNILTLQRMAQECLQDLQEQQHHDQQQQH